MTEDDKPRVSDTRVTNAIRRGDGELPSVRVSPAV